MALELTEPTPASAPAARPGSVWTRHWPFLLTTVLFVAVRLPLLLSPAIWKGWQSDVAILGLMGKRMLEGELAIFFWGQNYLGPLTSMVTAAWALLLGVWVEPPLLWPLSLRLASASMIWTGIAIFRAGARLHAPLAAEILALLLALGPPVLYRSSVVATGAEMVFLIGSVLFLFVAKHLAANPGAGILDSPWGRFGFGAVTGFGWWMNQGIVFYLVGAGWILGARTEWWRRFREVLAPLDRLAFRSERLGWPPLSPAARAGLLLLEAIPLTQIALWLLHDLVSPSIPMPFVIHPVAEPIGALIVLHLAVAFAQGEAWTRPDAPALRAPRGILVRALPAIGGFLLGWSPVWLGRILGWYPPSYSFSIRIGGAADAIVAARTLAVDLSPQWLGVGGDAAGIAALVAIGLALGAIVVRHGAPIARMLRLHSGEYGLRGFALAVLLVNLAYFILTQMQTGTPHYLVAGVSMLAVLLAGSIEDLWSRRAAKGLAVLLASVLIATALAGGLRVNASIAADEDPRPRIAEIQSRGFAICYADYWVAYKLQFLSGESVRFIPWRSFDRNRRESERLRAVAEPKCSVTPEGLVVDLPDGVP